MRISDLVDALKGREGLQRDATGTLTDDGQQMAMIQHQHLADISAFQIEEPEQCGSEFFIIINNMSLGFSRDELIEFGKLVQECVAYQLTNHDAPKDTGPRNCIICGEEVTSDNEITTTIGTMHEECRVAG